jgi:heat shock protein HspQ
VDATFHWVINESGMKDAIFSVGQLVRHRLFRYRGVVFDVDPIFLGSEEWYEQVAKSRPPKDEPWYHVLVHNAVHQTYVAERNLDQDDSGERIQNPEIEANFSGFDGVRYTSRARSN